MKLTINIFSIRFSSQHFAPLFVNVVLTLGVSPSFKIVRSSAKRTFTSRCGAADRKAERANPRVAARFQARFVFNICVTRSRDSVSSLAPCSFCDRHTWKRRGDFCPTKRSIFLGTQSSVTHEPASTCDDDVSTRDSDSEGELVPA